MCSKSISIGIQTVSSLELTFQMEVKSSFIIPHFSNKAKQSALYDKNITQWRSNQKKKNITVLK